MKIIGGKLKGRNFYMPAEVRPTQNLICKALFDILGQDLSGMQLLELFAGSGAVGFEAIPRGAKQVILVEGDPKNTTVIKKNIELLGLNDPISAQTIELLETDAFATIKLLSKAKKIFDIVFLDPPYGHQLAKKALNLLSAYVIVHPNSLVVIEHDKREVLPEEQGSLILNKQKIYGKTNLSFYKLTKFNSNI